MLKKRGWLIGLIFWLHLPIVILWFGLFAVPRSVWPGRITFHFWFIVILLIVQFSWGFILRKKLDMICPLTTLMQYWRGYPCKDQNNYGHSFIAELSKKLKIKIHYHGVNIILLITLIIVFIQYFFFR
jgi:hypothetical protein